MEKSNGHTSLSCSPGTVNSIAVIGVHLPRQCGIATFTTHLTENLMGEVGEGNCRVVAMNDKPEGYDYPDTVRFAIAEQRPEDYELAADVLNLEQCDVICLQHEFGIFGGSAGSHILKTLSELRKPVVTTLHTVLTEPSDEYRNVMLQLAELSSRLVVMSQKAVRFLQEIYGVDPAKIAYIPHGIPSLPFVDPNYYKAQYGIAGKKILLTFGLLSRNKGIEYAIGALPAVIERYPDVVYIVLGATHPHVKNSDGESYRQELQRLVSELKLDDHVIFYDRFVQQEELCDYLCAADIYVTPYLGEAQITSGTLAYAMGAGKAVVSTPYWYAEEMLDDCRGRLVPFRRSDAISEALLDILDDESVYHLLRKRAYDFCKQATWPNVASQYMKVFEDVKAERLWQSSRKESGSALAEEVASVNSLPAISLEYLLATTDDVGILQHAKYTIPEREHGYCLDDNARALIVSTHALRLLPDRSRQLQPLANRYLAFLLHAIDMDSGRFRNFMGYDRRWLESVGSEDSQGRALWALGVAVSQQEKGPRFQLASKLFRRALPAAQSLSYSRSIATALLGMCAYQKKYSGDLDSRRAVQSLAEKLLERYRSTAEAGWLWLEDELTYDNARIPQALILASEVIQDTSTRDAGLSILEWLLEIQTEEGIFVPVGNRGWYRRGEIKARYDQQPLEAAASIEACIAAYKVTQSRPWLDEARRIFSWFLGRNSMNLPLYNPLTGGCKDGLEPDSVNENEGAESTLAFLQALTSLHEIYSIAGIEEPKRKTSTIVSISKA